MGVDREVKKSKLNIGALLKFSSDLHKFKDVIKKVWNEITFLANPDKNKFYLSTNIFASAVNGCVVMRENIQ